MNLEVRFEPSFQCSSPSLKFLPYLSIRSNRFEEEEDAMRQVETPKISGELKKNVNNLKTKTLSH